MDAVNQYDDLGLPTTLLGMSYRSWTRENIRIILDHYRWRYNSHTKRNLMHELDLLVQEYGLDPEDRRDIFTAIRRDQPLPRCKPRVRRVPHTTLPDRKSAAPRALAQNPAHTRTRSQTALAASTTTTLQAPNKTTSTNPAQTRTRSQAALAASVNTTLQGPKKTSFTNPGPQVTSSLSRDCIVCYETLNARSVPQRRITSACNHEPDVCRSCLATSISTQFNSKVWDQIACPSCSQRLGFQDVKAFADPDVFTRSGLLYNLESKHLTF